MGISNAYCKKCKEIEPQDWDYEKEGLWTCKCRSKINKCDLDKAIKAIQEKITKETK